MEIVVTKTAIEETDPITARVKAARINRQLEELTDSALAFGYEYDEDELKAYYELTGDEETVDQLLAMLDEPCTEEETKRCLKAERSAAKREQVGEAARKYRRGLLLGLAAVCGIGAGLLLLSDLDD